MANMMSLGLIGCGAVVHANYAGALVGRDAYKVEYVRDTNPSQAASAASLFDAEVVSLEAMADRADAIIISTPPSTHSALVRACLRPGRRILCEKPYMTTYRDAVEVEELAQAADALVYVGHFRRLFPQLELARNLVALGVIGDVTGFSASEGGRFTWKAVSSYTTQDPNGGVLWDTGSHTLDMALYASALDQEEHMAVTDIRLERDRKEPSHDFRSMFNILAGERVVSGAVHVSRKEVLPNMVRIVGTRGRLAFVTDMDDRLRLATEAGSVILHADRSYTRILECFELQLRRVLCGDRAEPFASKNFIGQVKLMEALTSEV
jgi:predicted dehydrogenase